MTYNLAWMLAGIAIGHKLDMMPLDEGTIEAEVGHWRLVINNSRFHLTHNAPPKPDIELPPYEIYAEHLERDATFGLIGPDAGLIGGYTENQFIADMVAYLPPSALENHREDLERRKEIEQ